MSFWLYSTLPNSDKNYAATQMTEANYQAVSISAVSDEDCEIYSNEY